MLKKNISQIIGGVALSAILLAPAFGAKPVKLAPDPEPTPASDVVCEGCVDTTDIASGAVTLNELGDDVFSEFTPTGEAAKLAGVTNVALSGGDYSNPVDAMWNLANWCGIPSSTNQCLVKIAPGTYDLVTDILRMEEWVSIQGSGQETTKLIWTGRFAILSADNVALTDLTVEITGDADATAIFNQNYSPRIERVHAIAAGAGGSAGVYNQNSHTIMNNVTASASGGGSYNYGVRSISGSSSTMTNVTASASGRTNSFGIRISLESFPFIKDSTFEGDTNGVYIHWDSPGTRVVNSKIVGGVDDYDSGTQCRGNYDENLTDVDC